MKKAIYFFIFSIAIFFSCGTTKLESNLQRIELGMTKQEVSSILGKNYTIMGSGRTPDGNIETWSYTDPNIMESDNKKIIVNFLDGRLDEWHREYIPTPPAKRENDKHNHD